jgi:hypothetical protein
MQELRDFSKGLPNELLVALAVLLTSCLVACAPADAVATFASTTQKSLENGTAVFDDMPASILRRDCYANIEDRPLDFEPVSEACVKDADEQKNLADAQNDRDSLIAIQQILIDYFTGIQQLAEFGKSSDNGNKVNNDSSKASSAASKLKSSGKATSITADEATLITGLAKVTDRLLTAGYRSRQLSNELADADKAIAAVVGALTRVVQIDYMFDPGNSAKASLLNLEAHRMQEVYRDAHGDSLLLKISWTDHVTKLMSRNSSAQSYIQALEKIQGGHHQLATQPTHLHAQGLANAIQPYISSLNSLIPKIQKVF